MNERDAWLLREVARCRELGAPDPDFHLAQARPRRQRVYAKRRKAARREWERRLFPKYGRAMDRVLIAWLGEHTDDVVARLYRRARRPFFRQAVRSKLRTHIEREVI